jgi:endonuclease YncB( thermonuclease family)
MIRRLGIWLLLTALFALWAFSDDLFPPEKISAATATVKDGDTLVLDGRAFRILGIDAPEYHQLCKDKSGADWPCGKAARAQMVALVTPGALVCAPQANDKYGRAVASCASATVPDLGEAMVQSGLAINFGGYGNGPYGDAEAAAKSAQRGIWQGQFDAPSDWRAAHPRITSTPQTQEKKP